MGKALSATSDKMASVKYSSSDNAINSGGGELSFSFDGRSATASKGKVSPCSNVGESAIAIAKEKIATVKGIGGFDDR